ncbi:unnamed protein product [Cuscuta epithymum]|uniref:MADS-box domain-containing protein n=1 Tax=Cuscuta epithymum TaxID=186058 RepID=A0AAV0EVW6_9ASTE|nr:unnamed protein product [Cuscuta epithymum]
MEKTGKGKSKIPIKMIESRSARNVCFSKRRQGLFKKASDLCRLFPGVKVAAVVFSPAGTPYVYGDPNGIFEQGGGSPPSALFPSPVSCDRGENTAWNSGGPLADEVIESVIQEVQQRQLKGGFPVFPPQYPSPSSVLAGGDLISEPCGYSPIEKETINTPEMVGWEDDWLIDGEEIESMIRELQPQQGGGPAFPEYSSPPSSVPGDRLISGPSIQPEILREEDVSSMIQELLS